MPPIPKPPPPPKNEVLFRIIKIIDIAYIAVLYFVISYVLGYYIDNYFRWLYGTEYDKKSNMVLSLEVLSQIIAIAVLVYIGRNIVELIPFPLDGVNGFVHQRVKELKSGAFMTVFIVMFQYSMQDKLMAIKRKYNTENKTSKASPAPEPRPESTAVIDT